MNLFQRTIKRKISFSGVGLHTGFNVNITLKPSRPNTGCTFIRIDKNNTVIEVCIKNIKETDRSTTIGNNGIYVKTIEHLTTIS